MESNPCTGLLQAHRVPEVEAPRFLDNRHMMVVMFTALRTASL